ncbi:AtzE family amidohydrolase [Pantoea sp. Nvir]|uniref:AtzE family amidohydrolase n=1 Tax=Pantoea sp. Nvir TaxID=2576760 RepID=UPI00135B835E|nr:AtzE family amidohydrolase [Pantoea sp. Nvir]MXP66961.1 AtzE family amidohydrolase [Pantoea sp. Nvir]CAJ0992499.1 1-carboxybiuret hydrolase subunit AtzE [Pantoea sp. Nvir]
MNFGQFSIQSLQQALKCGDFSAREVAQQTLLRIKKRQVLNAWTDITAKRMLYEADEVDAQLRRGDNLPPLAGIPYAVKNLFDVAGYTTLAGAALFQDRPAAEKDAWAVNRLSHAGALLSGMLNMDAYAYGFTTENTHFGTTRNPHDLTRVAGGSSGGSAAAVAAGLVHFSLGTDTNGSIRVPASLCGIFGLKPTFGRLSRSGSHPFVPSLDHIGFFARCVTDLSQVYDILQGRDINDAFQADHPCDPTLTGLKNTGQRCALLSGFFSTWCDDDARDVLMRVTRTLDIQDEVMLPEAELARSAAFILTAAESGNHYLRALRTSPKLFEPTSRERLLAGAMLPATWYVQAQRFRRYFQKKVLPLFEHFDVMIAPATPCTAPLIGQENIRINSMDMPSCTSMGLLTQPISFLGLPVCSVPLATKSGLPIGLQLIAAPFNEAAVLNVAFYLEQQGVTLSPICFGKTE